MDWDSGVPKVIDEYLAKGTPCRLRWVSTRPFDTQVNKSASQKLAINAVVGKYRYWAISNLKPGRRNALAVRLGHAGLALRTALYNPFLKLGCSCPQM